MAATATSVSEVTSTTTTTTDGPVLSLINKRIRALKKKYNRIIQMEESIAQGKPINKEQEDVLRSKPSVSAAIDELEKLRQPLSVAVSEEIELAVQQSQSNGTVSAVAEVRGESQSVNDGNRDVGMVEDLLNLLYFGSLFDVKSQHDFASTMFTRTHERGCCLTYDTVTDDATDLLGERDLDMISNLGGLLISRPVNSSLSHQNALQHCIEHAKLWLSNSNQPIDSVANVSYAELREKLNKIMSSVYFTTTPEIKAPVEVAAAAAGNYTSFQVPFSVPVQGDDSSVQYQPKEEETENFHGHETGDSLSSPSEEPQKDELEPENPSVVVQDQHEQDKPSTEFEHNQTEFEHNQSEIEPKEQQYVSRRNYQNQRGGRGGGNGGRRGHSNGRGGRGGGGRGGGSYQNGRNQYYDQPGNFYPRNYNNTYRGRGSRGGGHQYNHHNSGGHAPADVGVAS